MERHSVIISPTEWHPAPFQLNQSIIVDASNQDLSIAVSLSGSN